MWRMKCSNVWNFLLTASISEKCVQQIQRKHFPKCSDEINLHLCGFPRSCLSYAMSSAMINNNNLWWWIRGFSLIYHVIFRFQLFLRVKDFDIRVNLSIYLLWFPPHKIRKLRANTLTFPQGIGILAPLR